MPIKPAQAFHAFQKEGEGLIIKARENARGNHVLCLTKSQYTRYRFLCFSPSISCNGLIVWKPKQEFKVMNHNVV